MQIVRVAVEVVVKRATHGVRSAVFSVCYFSFYFFAIFLTFTPTFLRDSARSYIWHLCYFCYLGGDIRPFSLVYRYAEGKYERLADLAADLVSEKPDLLLALGGDVAPYAAKATVTIPIVFVSSADPVHLGLAASLARPARNATEVTLLLDDTASKRLELLKEAVPGVQRAAFLRNPDHPDNELTEAQRAAQILSMRLHLVEMHGSSDLENALRAVSDARAEALYVVSSRHTVLNILRIVEFATINRLPLVGGWGAWARAGGLLSFGPNTNDMARRATEYVDEIIRGAKPADLPIQQPTKFVLPSMPKQRRPSELRYRQRCSPAPTRSSNGPPRPHRASREHCSAVVADQCAGAATRQHLPSWFLDASWAADSGRAMRTGRQIAAHWIKSKKKPERASGEAGN